MLSRLFLPNAVRARLSLPATNICKYHKSYIDAFLAMGHYILDKAPFCDGDRFEVA